MKDFESLYNEKCEEVERLRDALFLCIRNKSVAIKGAELGKSESEIDLMTVETLNHIMSKPNEDYLNEVRPIRLFAEGVEKLLSKG